MNSLNSKHKIEKSTIAIHETWEKLSFDSIQKIKSIITDLIKDRELQHYLQSETKNLPKGLELYRDQSHGFILLAYAESQDTYRIPHDHGNAWVLYAVVSGKVKMGSYFKATQPNGNEHLILKNYENLQAGDTRIYFPGEIHDTLCLSETAVILRLTSLDLRVEENSGRMKRYPQKDT